MRLYLILAAALAAGGAHAENTSKWDTNTEAQDWTGFYAGAQFGTGRINISDSETDEKAGLKGYGLHVGYMHDFGSLVAGGELAYNRLSFNDYTGHVHNGLLRLKGGYDLGHYMPYVAVGVGHLSGGSDGFSEVGPAFGVGVSLKTAENVTVSAEYTWQKVTHDYKRPVIVFGRPSERFETVQTDLRTGLFQTKVSFKF